MSVATALIACTLFTSPSTLGDIRVPADYPTIQTAIAAAVDGDRILVDPGTYGPIRFLGKAITVESTAGAASTIINGGGPRGAPAAIFDAGETRDAILRGFTLTNGGGLNGYGGNVYVSHASPLIEDNEIVDNAFSPSDYGGGVYALHSDLTLRNNRIAGNFADRRGGGLYLQYGEPTLIGNRIEANISYDGAGLYMLGGKLTLEDNEIVANDNDLGFYGSGYGSGAYLDRGVFELHRNHFEANLSPTSSALYLWQPDSVLVEENTFHDNLRSLDYLSADTSAPGTIRRNLLTQTKQGILISGGSIMVSDNRLEGVPGVRSQDAGIWVWGGESVVERNTVRGFDFGFNAGRNISLTVRQNRFEESGVHGVYLMDDAAILQDNLINGSGSSAIWCSSSRALLQRLTITGGTSNAPGAGLYVSGGKAPRVESCIIWGNTAPSDPSIDDETGQLIVEWSNVEGGYAGAGNLDVDPAFRNPALGDYRLSAGSPCLDMGSPTDDPCTDADPRGTPRCLDGDLDQLRRVDMGAFEFTHADLKVQGSFTPGGAITIDVTGTAGMRAAMFVGIAPDSICDPRYGGLFVSLSGGLLLPWGTVPSTTNTTVPHTFPTPLDLYLQVLAVDGATNAGSASNLVVLPIR